MYSRISHVAGREGHAPDFLSYVHIEKKTPIAPILLNVRHFLYGARNE